MNEINYNYDDTVTTNEYHLAALENLDDWKVHSDDPDIRNWNLYDFGGKKIGKVTNLIADTELKKVRYVEVELDESLNTYRDYRYRNSLKKEYHSDYGNENDRHIIVPIGALEINEDDAKVVASPNLSLKHFSSSPRYSGIRFSRITPLYELLTMKYYTSNDENYRDTYANDKYKEEDYRKYPNIRDRDFYGNDLFSRGNYIRRYKQNKTSMSGFRTGMPQR